MSAARRRYVAFYGYLVLCAVVAGLVAYLVSR